MGTKLVEKGITRYDIDEQGTYGFMVRISRQGEHTNEFFSDKNYKGKRKALDAARKRYKQLVAKLPPPTTTKGVITARNQTGMVGVHLAVCESVYGEAYSSYCASWKSENGKRKKISFSFKKYGKKKAWEMACIARERESIDRAKIESLHSKRVKSKKKLPPAPKPTVLAKDAGKKKKAKKAKKVVKKKKKAAKKKVVAKKATAKKKPSKKKASPKRKAAKKSKKRKKR